MPAEIDSTAFTALASAGSAIVGALAVVVAMVRARSHKDGKIFDAIHAGDRALDTRLRSQETTCSETRGMVVTELRAIHKTLDRHTEKLDRLIENGGGQRS